VFSLTTGAAGNDVLVNLAGTFPRVAFMIKLSREVAVEVFVGIRIAAQKFGWWGDDFQLRGAD
jgi:hypothetical protein